MKKILLIMIMLFFVLSGCAKNTNKVVICTSSDENEIALIREMLNRKFSDYDIRLEYFSTGDHAAKLKAEGTSTECDISYDLEYGYLMMLNEDNIFAKLEGYDVSIFLDDLIESNTILPTMRYGGAIIVNQKVIKDKGLKIPSNYHDLLLPEYANLISMPSPKASGTGYMFLKSLSNSWGETETIAYFDKLAKNILQFTSSGSGPVNSLIQEEVAIAIGMTSHAALKITDGYPLEILFFEEGSPYLACGATIIQGKENRNSVVEVFRYFYDEVTPAINKNLYPEQIYKDVIIEMENYPKNIPYADMSNNTSFEKERLLDLWNH